MIDSRKEFQTIALAALFHDIGKVLNRTKDGYGKNHTDLTKQFLDELMKRCENIKEFVDESIFSHIASHHHEGASKLFKPKELSGERERFLATIISRADNFSSSERYDDEDANQSDRSRSRMRSIFYNLKFENVQEVNLEDGFYEIRELEPESVFLKKESQLNREGTQFAYKELAKKITDNIIRIEAGDNFNLFFSSVLSILEKYLALIPSSTQVDKQDISLFDHLSTTSAIACAYYLFIKDNQINKVSDLDKLETDESVKPFVVLQGDVSGIQNFILKIKGSNPRGLAKTLRGRSFYISALSRAVSLKIINDFELVQSNIFLDAGGKFSILLPNTTYVKKRISEISKELDKFFFSEFAGLLSLNLTEPVELGVKDFVVEDEKKKKGFRSIFEQVNFNNQIAKSNKFFSLFKDEVLSDKYLEDFYKKLKKAEDLCELCGTFPKDEGSNKCKICKIMENIGTKITKEKFWAIYSINNKNCVNEIMPGVCLEILEKEEEIKEKLYDSFVVDRFFDVGREEAIIGARRWINNYLPRGKDFDIDIGSEEPKKDTLCYLCNDRCHVEKQEYDEIVRENVKYGPLTFQCIATYSRFLASNNQAERTGEDHLGVLKADVDNLGKLFKDSMKEKFSISRVATVSRFLNYFFTEVLQDIIEKDENKKFKAIYTVYSGGDDLFLIGPWIILPDFALHLSKKFREFTGRDAITFSCAIEMFRPRSSIGRAVEIVDRSLEMSKSGHLTFEEDTCREFKNKNNNKNKIKGNITVFKNTVRLFKRNPDEFGFEELLQYRDRLCELCKNNGEKEAGALINKAFLYRLLSIYRPMFLRAKGYEERGGYIKCIDKNVISYRYIPLLKRDIKRNIVKDRKDKDLVEKKLTDIKVLMELDDKKVGQFYMKNLKIPVFLTLYKLRGGE
ncbi:CRISPR-associated protein, Csm1 family [Thermodesulfobium narugense DSM 14796]|uniref:CRISPR system single-strand-specific deoxyribonuclease Cas10/Csm1 (subtype III-A) n=1 Tax=Thermodesulfobium narugense DSM 14796 TaxID=747365 RepID=M1E953_9BACT|nr:type III-A CRISPR-associated protein Cas10/Csm1 [Thermodesulfobium narugense]AEE15340.1 CRISPR-associated protein, Csm1 family [Thermodesulfobium narugense DSM 14796]